MKRPPSALSHRPLRLLAQASLVLGLGACAPTCSCSDTSATQGPTLPTPGRAPVTSAPQAPNASAATPRPTDAAVPTNATAVGVADAAVGTRVDTTAPSTTTTQPPTAAVAEQENVEPRLPATVEEAFPDFVRATTSTQLKQAKQRVAALGDMPRSALANVTKLASILPDRLAGLEPAEIMPGPTRAGDQPISVATRKYESDERGVYIKISDTAQAAFMRQPLLDALDKVGNVHDGFSHGRFVEGAPVVLRYFPAAKSGQLLGLVGDRYIIDVRVRGATSAYDALEVFKTLRLTALNKR